VSKVVRTAISGTGSPPSQWLTRFYTQYTGTAPVNADLASFDTAIDTAFNTNLKPLMNGDKTALQIESVDLTSPTAAVDIKSISRVGTRAGGVLPAQICVVQSYGIARRYRGGHPRGYWPFGSDSDLSVDDIWIAGSVTAFDNGLDAFFTAVAAAGWAGAGTLTHVNVSYFAGFTVVVSPTTGRARNVPTLRGSPVVDPVTSTTVRASIGTQRRRAAFIL
jgi:hypothetical protein